MQARQQWNHQEPPQQLVCQQRRTVSRHHNRNKKASDPFLQLDDEAVKLPDVSGQSKMREDGNGLSNSLLADR